MIGGGAAFVGVRGATNSSGINRSARTAWRVVGVASLLLVLSMAANFYQLYTQRAAEQARLEATLIRPTEVSDGHTLDPNLKEISYADQLSDPRGISTNEVERLIKLQQRGLQKDVALLDVREKAEAQMGTLPGATAIRFPDISRTRLSLAGKTAVLVCDSGNRSYQACQALAAIGIDCRFMIGGLEKWLSEKKPLGNTNVRSLAEFRALPSYRNKSVLLDTGAVRELVAKGAQFVDVRYPGEFSAYHLPEAINLPIRPTPSEDLRERIATLPHHPIIAPCYDRRSCFYAQILGFEVTKAGYDFRGRYTVPWDYFVPLAPRPYIKQWLNEANQSWWHRVASSLAVALNKLADGGGFVFAIVLLATFSRTLVLPVSLKAERDQIISKVVSPQVDELKRRLKDDPRRLARAMRAFYRQHGLTPLRNMLGLLFLPLMSVCVAAVQAVANQRQQPILWVTNSALRDPTFVLPMTFAALICVYLDSAFVRTRSQRLLVWIIGLILLTGTGALLSAAADIYLIASAGLLLLQRAVATGKFGHLARWIRRRWLSCGVVSLDDVERLAGCGNKAYRLGRMRSQGYTVPEGVVLTSDFLAKFATASPEWRSRELDRVWRTLAVRKVAVRSSGGAEDGSSNSFAGVYESVLNVDRPRLEAAVTDVLSSFGSAVAGAYGAEGGGANIIIQRMIEPDHAGVLFTRDPAQPSFSVVELVEGTADKLVSGEVAPALFRFGRSSLRLMGSDAPSIDLQPLVGLGRELEQLFGRPQDVEWASKEGCFYIVQSRDITRLDGGADVQSRVQQEWSRVLDRAAGAPLDETVFEQNELSEVLPRPTVLSLSLMESLWASGGSVDLACRTLGLGYRVDEGSPPYLMTIFGRLYIDKRQEHARAPKLNSLAIWRMNRLSERIERDFRNEFLPTFLKQIALLEAVDFDKLSTSELLQVIMQIRRNFVVSTNVTASVINIAADYYLQRARKKLNAAGMEAAHYLAHDKQTVFERAISNAINRHGDDVHAALIRDVGHRAAVDYEFAEPRYADAPAKLYALVSDMMLPARTRLEINSEMTAGGKDVALQQAVRLACEFQTLKEDAKHHTLREFAVLRRAVLALDRRLEFDGLIFELTFDDIELMGKDEVVESLRSLARERHQRAMELANMPPANPSLTVLQIEDGAIGSKSKLPIEDGKLAGIRVSGTSVVEGRACVVTEDDPALSGAIPGFKDGDIVVSRMVSPAWIPYFQRANGFVCEVGGWLSHAAIVAREFDVPLIVQAKGLRSIESGTFIRLHLDGTVEISMEQPIGPASG